MKKPIKPLLVGASLLGLLGLKSCQNQQNVYGPPPSDEPGNYQDEPEDVYGPPEYFDPNYKDVNDEPEAVYGPPVEEDEQGNSDGR